MPCCNYRRKLRKNAPVQDQNARDIYIPKKRCCHLVCHRHRRKLSILYGRSRKIPANYTVIEYVEECFRKHKSKLKTPAIINPQEDRMLTFEELENLATKVAVVLTQEVRSLITSNPDGDVIIGVCTYPSERTVILMLSILKTGMAYMCLDTMINTQMLIHHVGSTRPIAIIIDDALDIVKQFDVVSRATKLLTLKHVFTLAENFVTRKSLYKLSNVNTHLPEWERTAVIALTLGTNTYPKSIRIVHRSILNIILWYASTFTFKPGEVCALSSQIDSANAIAEIFVPLTQAIPLVILPRHQIYIPQELTATMLRHKITRINLQPHHIFILLTFLEKNPGKTPKQLRYLSCNHFVPPIYLVEKFFQVFHDHGHGLNNNNSNNDHSKGDGKGEQSAEAGQGRAQLVVTYGATEVTGDVTYRVFTGPGDVHLGKIVDLGQPIWNTKVYIVDGRLNLVDLCVRGEICVSGLMVSSGLCTQASESFLKNPFSKSSAHAILYRTGDYGRMVPDSEGKPRLYFEKRLAIEVTIEGRMFDLDKITRLVLNSELVQDCVTICYHPQQIDQRIVASCVLKPKVTELDVSNHLTKNLVNHILVEVFSINSLPFQPNGKIDKPKILKQYSERREDTSDHIWDQLKFPSAKLEQAQEVLTAIAQVLSVSVTHLVNHFHSSFYEAGGDSLNTMSAVRSLCIRGYPISLDDFINSQSLQEILAKSVVGHDRLLKTKSKYLVMDYYSSTTLAGKLFSSRPLEPTDDQLRVNQIIATAYATKSVLCLYANISAEAIATYLNDPAVWESFLNHGLSHVAVSNKTNEIVGSILCVENLIKPRRFRTISGRYILELQYLCCIKAVEKVRGEKSKILYVSIFGTDAKLSASENILMMEIFLKQIGLLAHKKKYHIMLLLSANPALVSLCGDTVKYSLVDEVPLNTFRASDGSMPFNRAQGHEKVTVYCRYFQR